MKKIAVFILSMIMMTAIVMVCPLAQSNVADLADNSNVLVVYFSCTKTTEGVAKNIQKVLGSELYEIEPLVPYTAADLNYNDPSSRANQEQNNTEARPEILGAVDIEKYNAIFIGYPIWHGKAPKIIYTFLEKYDFSGKMLIPFCTSGSSGIGGSENEIHALAPKAKWMEGKRFSGSSSEATVKAWTDTIQLPEPNPTANPEMTICNDIVTVNNAPDNSTLIVAFYKEKLLVSVKVAKGNGTITENISDQAANTDLVKAFLWNTTAMKPLCEAQRIRSEQQEMRQIKVASTDYEIVYTLNDSQAANDLYAQLPFTIEVENFGSNEKVFYPPQKLNTANTPLASGGKGKLAYYAPWGDVVMFYDSFSENRSLYELGEIVAGAENIENLTGTITISAK